MTIIIFLTILISVLINEMCCLKETKPVKPCLKFIVVVDGWSSGTTMHLFGFEKKDNYMKLNVTDKMSSKIAVSKYPIARENWSLLRILFHNFTTFAISKIPAQCLAKTPIYVQVTDGVRQLGKPISQIILNLIRSIYLKSKFKFKPEFVDILSIEQEGRLAWISVNYLLGKFQTRHCLDTVGMLDLGVRSTQISFATNDLSLISESKKMVVFGQLYYLYTAGYDYMGIDEIRLKFFDTSRCLPPKCEDQIKLSYCMHPNVSTNFDVGFQNIKIAGIMDTSEKRYFYCILKVNEMIKHIKKIRHAFYEMKFVAISAFYDILKSAFDITKHNETDLMKFKLSEMFDRMKIICASPKNDTKNFIHFQCMDMAYVTLLLKNGYDFTWSDKITISNKINKISSSWTLGYAISML